MSCGKRRQTGHESGITAGDCRPIPRAFSLLELLVVVAIIAIMAALLFPALSRAKSRTLGLACLNNARQLTVGWALYADDHDSQLPYNLGGVGARRVVAIHTNLNWVNNVLTWDLDSDNTNTTTVTEASLGPYVSRAPGVYRCPSDSVLSDVQRAAGWTARVRSYSMNAMVGDAGELSQHGYNVNNPGFVQFFKITSIPSPAKIFVFLDEHPDSINDGYFLNKGDGHAWIDLPASYHNGAASFAFADGHSELHRWQGESTRLPPRAFAATLPAVIPSGEQADFAWMLERMSVDRDHVDRPSD